MVVWRFVLLPDLHGATDETRATLRDQFRKRWFMIVNICITFLLISGLVNYVLFIKTYKQWGDLWRESFAKPYNILFGIKFIIAMAVFFVSSALAGRSAGLQKFRDNAKFWLNVNLILILSIVVISGVMRQTHLTIIGKELQR